MMVPRRRLILAISLLLVNAALSAAAPAGSIASLNVDIWPEHDDPRVLVIYRGTLSAEAALPYALTLSIPSGAQLHAVAYRRDGQLFSMRYETAAAGTQTRITFSLPAPEFQFEYYLDVLSPPPQRTFAVSVAFPLVVADLRISVEQPLRSSQFALTPAPPQTTTSGGFVYSLYAERRWPAGKIWSVRGTYRKEDSVPSLAAAAPPAPAPAPPVEGERTVVWLVPALIGVLAGVGSALLVGYVLRSRPRRRTAAGGVSRRQGRRVRGGDEGQARYCAHCGRRAGPRDRFCSNCGRPLPDAS